jgi:hypothetical protein
VQVRSRVPASSCPTHPCTILWPTWHNGVRTQVGGALIRGGPRAGEALPPAPGQVRAGPTQPQLRVVVADTLGCHCRVGATRAGARAAPCCCGAQPVQQGRQQRRARRRWCRERRPASGRGVAPRKHPRGSARKRWRGARHVGGWQVAVNTWRSEWRRLPARVDIPAEELLRRAPWGPKKKHIWVPKMGSLFGFKNGVLFSCVCIRNGPKNGPRLGPHF